MGRKPHRSRSVNLILGLAKTGILMSFVFTLSYLVVKAYDYGARFNLSTAYIKTLPYSETALDFLNKNNLVVQEPEVASLQDKRPAITPERGVLRVALLTDAHNDFDNLQEAVNQALGFESDLAIFLGDYTTLGVLEDLTAAKAVMDTFGRAYYSLPGDHDLWKSSGLTNFVTVFGQSNQSFVLGGFKFILLNNSDTEEGITESDIQWLENELADFTYPSFLFIPNPLYNTNGFKLMGENNAEVLKQAQKLLQLVRAGNVKAVFAGDNHLSSTSTDPEKPDLTHYVIGALTNDRNLQSPRYSILDVYSDGTYKVTEIVLNTEK